MLPKLPFPKLHFEVSLSYQLTMVLEGSPELLCAQSHEKESIPPNLHLGGQVGELENKLKTRQSGFKICILSLAKSE